MGLLLVVLLSAASGDHDYKTCGQAGNVTVKLAGPVTWFIPLMTCDEALGVVRAAETRMKLAEGYVPGLEWTVVFRAERVFYFAGYTESGGPLTLRAFTNCEQRRIDVTAFRPVSVLHEFMHASDCDRGQWAASQIHQGWYKRGRAQIEQRFTGESITWRDGEK